MIDFQALATILYPTPAQAAPVVPSVEATTTTETAGTKTAESSAADAATHTTTDQITTTDHTAEVPYALTLPEDAVLEASAIERTRAFAKAAGLSPAAAQHALEHANAEVAADRARAQEQFHTLTRETWVNDVKNDPEIGGEKYLGAVTDAKRFLEKFGDEELRQFLDDTGFGNNKFVIRMLARAERRMASSGGRTEKALATTLYGTTPRR